MEQAKKLQWQQKQRRYTFSYAYYFSVDEYVTKIEILVITCKPFMRFFCFWDYFFVQTIKFVKKRDYDKHNNTIHVPNFRPLV